MIISWRVFVLDGGFFLKEYVLERRDIKCISWVLVDKVSLDIISYIV